MLLANGLSTFPIKGNPRFSNCPKCLSKNPSSLSLVFDNSILADELFGRA